MDSLPSPARYFPVVPKPYRMKVGLAPLGQDFGNGARDGLFFQLDSELARYQRAAEAVPAHRFWEHREGPLEPSHTAVIEWMAETLCNEHPAISVASPTSYATIAAAVQEDFAVIHRGAEGDSAIASYVRYPSGWRPERIANADFKEIHAPVPGFADQDAAVSSMVATMIERGPYTRFVWTIAADANLDHHPEEGKRQAWSDEGSGWLRVERQVTVPFPDVSASLFLIRTYLYSFASLEPSQRRDLAKALELMPADVARYKGLDGSTRAIARGLLE